MSAHTPGPWKVVRQRKPPAGDFTERLAKAVARYVTAEPEDKHVVQIAKRYGISHTTLRKTLRETGILAPKKRMKRRPPCGHSRCSQAFIDTGKPWCIEAHDIDCDLDEGCSCQTHGSSILRFK